MDPGAALFCLFGILWVLLFTETFSYEVPQREAQERRLKKLKDEGKL